MLFYLKEACGKTFCKAEHSFFFLEGIFLSLVYIYFYNLGLLFGAGKRADLELRDWVSPSRGVELLHSRAVKEMKFYPFHKPVTLAFPYFPKASRKQETPGPETKGCDSTASSTRTSTFPSVPIAARSHGLRFPMLHVPGAQMDACTGFSIGKEPRS